MAGAFLGGLFTNKAIKYVSKCISLSVKALVSAHFTEREPVCRPQCCPRPLAHLVRNEEQTSDQRRLWPHSSFLSPGPGAGPRVNRCHNMIGPKTRGEILCPSGHFVLPVYRDSASSTGASGWPTSNTSAATVRGGNTSRQHSEDDAEYRDYFL